jgi:Na+-translocating ferredoxin:NAD+ oxidoreductase RnfD subunit
VNTTAIPTTVQPVEMQPYRQVHVGDRSFSLVPPSIRDPRLHLSAVIITILVFGITWLGFQVSIAQILVTMVTCAVIEVTTTAVRTKMLVWPASALQTGTSTSLLLRVVGTDNGDYWSLRGWYVFAGVAALGLLTKYSVRFKTGHVFNPSNVALVLAFILLGSNRVEPLDFWWAPLGPAMIAAYVVILVGGVFICSRLGLIGMGLAFWLTLAGGMGILAALGHSITTRWSLMPIEGGHFWWIILTSPEIFIFLYFMITDPRTVPSGRVARIVFGATVGVLASLLMAPWKTEFGTKVGLLSSLTVLCLCRPLLERRLPVVGSPDDDPRRFFVRVLTGRRHQTDDEIVPLPPRLRFGRIAVRGAAGALIAGVLAAGVAVAHMPSRVPASAAGPALASVTVEPVDPASLPAVTIDRDVAGLSASLASPQGAQELAATLTWNLQVETQAIVTGDASLLPAVDDGARLHDLESMIAASGADGSRVAPRYIFDTLHLEVVYPGGLQRGANAGLVASGTVEDVTYSSSGQQLSIARRPFAFTFSLRQTTNGHWLITDTLENHS